MKNTARILAGAILLLVVAVCPLPPLFAVSGVAWRGILGLCGCFLLVLGVYKKGTK